MKKLIGATLALGLATLLSAAPQTAQDPAQPSQTTQKQSTAHSGKKQHRKHAGKTTNSSTKKSVAKSGN